MGALRWLRIPVTLAVIGLVVWWVDAAAIWRALSTGRADLVAWATALVVVPVACSVGIWHILVGRTQPVRTSIVAILLGYTAGVFTPARAGEWAPRILVGPAEHRTARMGAAAREFLLRFSIHPFVLGALLPLAGPSLGVPWPVASSIACILLAAAMFFLGAHPDVMLVLARRLPFLRSRVPAGARSLTGSEQGVLLMLFLVRYGVTIAQYALLFLAFGLREPVQDRVVGAGIVLSAKGFIPNVMVTDLGVREGLAAFWATVQGWDPALLVAASLALYGVNVLLPALIGATVIPARSRSERNTDG
ncbi:MAG: lysylphosphatidylglycerol synthase domain-containing protein [Rhodothermales bacterium]